MRRLYICIPMFVAAIGLLLYSLSDANGFNMIWRYFVRANQTLAVFTLWAITVYLVRSGKTLLDNVDTGLIYDGCLLHLYLYCSRRIRTYAYLVVYHRRNLHRVGVAWFIVWKGDRLLKIIND